MTALQLDAEEQALFEPLLCDGRQAADTQPNVAVATLLDRLVAIGGWQASVALDATKALERATGGFNSTAREAQAGLLAYVKLQLDHCSAVGKSLEAGFERVDEGMYPQGPLELRDLVGHDSAPGCVELPARLEPLLDDFVLATYYGEAGDVVEVLVAGSAAWVSGAARYTRASGSGVAQVVVLPKHLPSSLVFRQAALDTPWVYSLAPTDSITKIPKPARELDIQISASEAAEVAVLVDGVPFEVAQLDVPLAVAEGSHTLAVTVDGVYRGSKQVETQADGRASHVPLDLHAGDAYGLTELSIDPNCAVAPPQVRKLVDQYFEQRGLEIQQLDVLAQILRSFLGHGEAMGEGLAVGAERLDYATERQIAKLAGEVARQGAQKLLTIEVTCRGADDELLIAGQVIDLDEFARRGESALRGKTVSDVLDVRTVTVDEPGELREGFEQMLGALIGAPTVEFITRPPPTTDLYRPLRIEYHVARSDSRPDAETREFELGVLKVSDASTTCRRARDVARLSSFESERLAAELDEANRLTAGSGHRARRKHTQLQLLETVTLAGSQQDLQAARDIPLRDAGHYLLWIRETDGPALSVVCFEVFTRIVELSAEGGGNLFGVFRDTSLITNMVHAGMGITLPLGQRRRILLGLGGEYRRTIYREPELELSDNPDGTVSEINTEKSTESWSRHGIGPVLSLGYRFPLSRCNYAFSRDPVAFGRQQERCKNVNLRRWTMAVQGSFATNVGGFNLKHLRRDSFRRESLDVAKRMNGHVYDVDIDLAIDLRIAMRVTPLVGVYLLGRMAAIDVGQSVPCHGDLDPGKRGGFSCRDPKPQSPHLGDERDHLRFTLGFGLTFYLMKTGS